MIICAAGLAAPRAGNRSLTAHRSILSLFRARNAAHVARSERYLRHGVCDKYESDLSESGGTGGEAFCSRRRAAPRCSGSAILFRYSDRRRYYTNEIVVEFTVTREIFARAAIFSNFPVYYRPFCATRAEVD